MKTHSVLIEFYHKSDAGFLLSNQTHQPKGVYIDCQYSDETKKERCKLRPIVQAVGNMKIIKENVRWKDLPWSLKVETTTAAIFTYYLKK